MREYRQLIIRWIVSHVGEALLLALITWLFMKLGQIEMLSIFGGFFLWLALRALSAAIAITLDITRNLKVEITGTLERKVEAKYIGGERDYQLWINDESFTVQKSKWDQMEVGARYRILFLKNSRLVLEIHHSNDY